MFTRTLLLLMTLSAVPISSLAAEPTPTPDGTAVTRFWWKWHLNREWSSEDRRATGTLETFSDEETTAPLAVARLRFTLEIDCPSAGRPERATFEANDASIVNASVSCADGTDGSFPVRWELDAQDEWGLEHDQGTWE
jgi:hypothetical protein